MPQTHPKLALECPKSALNCPNPTKFSLNPQNVPQNPQGRAGFSAGASNLLLRDKESLNKGIQTQNGPGGALGAPEFQSQILCPLGSCSRKSLPGGEKGGFHPKSQLGFARTWGELLGTHFWGEKWNSRVGTALSSLGRSGKGKGGCGYTKSWETSRSDGTRTSWEPALGGKEGKTGLGGKKMRDLSPFRVKSGVLGQKLPVGMRNSCPHLLVPSMIVRRQSRNTSEKEPRSWQLWIEGKQQDWHNSRIFWEGFLGIWCCPKSAGIEGIWGEPSSPPPARVWRPGTAQTAGKWEKQQRTTLNHSPKKPSF